MGVARSTHGKRNAYKTLVRKRMSKWQDNIKMDIKETGWEDVDLVHLAQERDLWRVPVNKTMNRT
jgi:hypothetical protein